MARRYVRDKSGRFAAKGGGGKRAGKLSKSTAGRGAKAKYKSAASGLREKKRSMATTLKNRDAQAKKNRAVGRSTVSRQKIRKTYGKSISQKKGQLTRVTNKLTGKGKAAGSGLKKGLRSQTASRRKQSFRSKATKGRTARAAYKKASSVDRKGRTDTGRKRVIKKQTGKPAYRSNTGFNSPQRTKQPRAGSKTKAQKIRAKIDLKKSYNKMERGSEFKGAKKRAATKKKAATKKTAATKASSSFGKTAKYTRQGKVSKASGKGRLAKAKYKKATSKLRGAERSFKSATRSSAVLGKKASRANWTEKATDKAIIAGAKKEKAFNARTGAKSRLTRVTNKMTNKGAAKAKISEKKQRAQYKAEALGQQKPLLRKHLAGRKKAAATRAQTAARKAAEKAKKRKERKG